MTDNELMAMRRVLDLARIGADLAEGSEEDTQANYAAIDLIENLLVAETIARAP